MQDQAPAAAAPQRRPSRSTEGQPLRFSAYGKPSQIFIRWCESWGDAICCSIPPRVVYLSTLFWMLKECTLERAGALVNTMLQEIGASLWPPTSWEALLENKDQVFAKFNKFMLPARWVTMRAVNDNVKRLASQLLGFCPNDGRYFVKGSCSCDADCAQSIVVAGGKCAQLAGLLRGWTESMHQQCFGIQPFVPGFGDFELRTWIVPDHVTKRWRSVLTIKTMLTTKGRIWGEQYQPLHGPGLPVARLIDEMLTEHAPFFEQLRGLGLPALRIDCGYDGANKRAFFSEFAACEAWMWSEVHGQDLAYVVGRAAGDRVWELAA